jgi:hypothetical protein
MSAIPSNTAVWDLVMPGSHDAGVATTNVELNYGVKESWAICQHGEILDQANAGSRFFDCRVFCQAIAPELQQQYKDKLAQKERDLLTANPLTLNSARLAAFRDSLPQHPPKQFRFGHFFKERAGDPSKHGGTLGAYGGSLKASIQGAIRFLHANPSEFLIMRFSHSGWPEQLPVVMKYWYEKYNGANYDPNWGVTHYKGNWANYIYRSPANIATETVGNLRGKLIMVFDGKHTGLDPTLGLHRFSKFEELDGGGVPARGLTTCGTYANSKKIQVVVNEALSAAGRHASHNHDHLHFVYYQQTVPMKSVKHKTLEANTTKKKTLGLLGDTGVVEPYTGGAHVNLPHFLKDLVDYCNTLKVPISHLVNVISHDFVDPNTCKQIIGLNGINAS